MFTSMTARVSTNTYCIARTRCFSRRSEKLREREAPTDTVQLQSTLHLATLGLATHRY